MSSSGAKPVPVIGQLSDAIDALRAPLTELFLTHSRLRYWGDDPEGIVFIGPKHSWEPLSALAQQLQS